MAQLRYSISLKDSIFQPDVENTPRTVINPAKGEVPEPIRTMFCENVVPTEYGYMSIVPVDAIPAKVTSPQEFKTIREANGDEGNRVYLGFANLGSAIVTIYVIKPGESAWTLLSGVAVPPSPGTGFESNDITVATVNAVSYTMIRQSLCYVYDESAASIVSTTLTGLTLSTILGLVASSGYLIAFSATAVAWSSTIDPTDFVPSTVTGAGGGKIAEARGAILAAVSTDKGFLLYTEGNVISATYTGNSAFPFKFKEVAGSAGVEGLDQTAFDTNSDIAFSYSNTGLQAINATKANIVLPELGVQLSNNVIESYNTTTGQFTDLALNKIHKKLRYIGNRYLVLSYGLSETAYTTALVYDTTLNRMGRFLISHVDVIDLLGTFELSPVANSIAFLNALGKLTYASFSSPELQSEGSLILGQLQDRHGKLLTIQSIEVQNTGYIDALSALGNLEVKVMSSFDGSVFTLTDGTLESTGTDLTLPQRNTKKFNFRATGINHSIILKGTFRASTLLVTYTIDGNR